MLKERQNFLPERFDVAVVYDNRPAAGVADAASSVIQVSKGFVVWFEPVTARTTSSRVSSVSWAHLLGVKKGMLDERHSAVVTRRYNLLTDCAWNAKRFGKTLAMVSIFLASMVFTERKRVRMVDRLVTRDANEAVWVVHFV